MQFLYAPILQLSVILLAMVSGVVVFRICRPMLLRRSDNLAVHAKARCFHERVCHFRAQATTLDQHSHEYVAVFNDDHWLSLMKLIEQLESVDLQVQNLLSRKQYSEALHLLSYISDTKEGSSSMEQIVTELKEVQALINWEHTVNLMLRRVISNLETASHTTQQIASHTQSRKRQSTLTTLADLKKTLLEDEAFNHLIKSSQSEQPVPDAPPERAPLTD